VLQCKLVAVFSGRTGYLPFAWLLCDYLESKGENIPFCHTCVMWGPATTFDSSVTICDFVILKKVFYFSLVNIDDGKYWQLAVYTIFTCIIYTPFAQEFGLKLVVHVVCKCYFPEYNFTP
jgi:hypothetical protein